MKRLALFVVLLFAVPCAAQVTLAWDASDTPNVTYNVHRSKTAGGCADVAAASCTKLNTAPINVLTFTDTTPVSGRFFYVATAVDADSIESIPSNELSVILPPKPPKNLRKT